ncbi:MAG: DNA cytosine methyltransferase, partial [Pseudomonadota bacterium]
FVENSPMLTSRGGTRVLGDLAEMGFDAKWGIVSAADVGAPHLRKRIWIVANAKGFHAERRSCRPRKREFRGGHWWKAQPDIRRVDDGVPHAVDRLKAIGNGQVPLVAATAWELLTQRSSGPDKTPAA